MIAWERKKIFVLLIVVAVLAGISHLSFSIPFRILQIEAPPFTEIIIPGSEFQTHPDSTRFSVILSEEASFPLSVTAKGPLGGLVIRTLESPGKLKGLKFGEKIIRDKNPNPQSLSDLPLLCPRLSLQGTDDPAKKPRAVYAGNHDRLNHIPMFQLLDPDAGRGNQYKSFVEMDGKNVLLLQRVTLTYDYEDSAIVDYEGPHPITGKPHRVNEGQGGFYANIHYAVYPFRAGDKTIDNQTLLHLVQGKLREINREDLLPSLRTHSLLPGPFLSKEQGIYEMCEWGDTAHQAPRQTVEYEEMALWDWDYSIPDADHIALVVWEGDEEDWLIRKELIHPFYLTDDLIGIFEIRKNQTVKPLVMKNKKGDFEITVQTGNLGFPP